LDFTGVSGWKEYAGNYVPYGATLITPRHFVAANHVLLANGTRVTFFDRNGKPVTRTVLNSRRISNTDISIGVLDGNVDSIAHYPVVDTATLKRLIDSDGDGRLDGVPIIIFNQLGETLVRKMTVLDSSSSPILPGAVVHSRYLDGFRAGFSKELIVGDSGHPIFTVINNTPVILAENYGTNLGHAPGSHIDEINSAIIALGDYGFRVTEYSLSSFEPAPSITVLTPPGSRPWQLGATQNITWQSTGISKVVISLCTGASTARRCERLLGITATGIANTNSYAWYISPDQPNIYDGNWNIRVASADTPSVFDDSNSFALLDPLIVSISSPAGNIFTAPASFTVRAEAQNTLGSVTKVEFYQNGAKVSEDTTAPYEYHAQNLVVGGYSFEAKAFNSRGDTARSGGTDVRVNDTPQPSITVLSPNGGEYFRTGAAMTINWKTANVPASHTFDVIRLRAYPNGQEYNLVHNIANDGQEIITIPSSIPIGTYTLEIKSYFNGVLVMDASDSYFKIVSADSTNLPPVVDGVSGPTSLKVGETGTWTIKARDPENGALSYSVDWGDGVPRVFITNDTAASPFVQQPSTFTHSYATAGRYNVKFTVTDDKGLTAQSSITVQVGSTVPPITVLSPNGGETWQKGTTQTIKWNSNLVSIPEQPIIYDISLVPYCPSGQVCATYAPFAIAQGVSGSTYTWNVGSTVGGSAPAGSYTVQICQSGTTTCDSSDSFFTSAASYTQPSITVLSPNGGESLVHGQTYEFRWTSNGLGRVSIQVSDGKGYSYSVAAGIPALPGSYSWTVSNRIPPASTYRAGIGWSAAYYDQSDSDFTIAASYTQPSITVLSPNGGEYFRTGAAMTINWKTANVPASHTFDVIRLRAYPNGQEYNLVHNIANDGQEIITIPSSIPIGTYTLEIKSYFNGVLVMDASDSYFKIVSADSTNLPPVVDGVSGPTSLKVGETGTWTIKARDPENGALSYSVDWGDGVPRVFITNDTAASPFVQQPSTFTHSYATAGRYNVKFTVTDDKGLTAQSSITVQVGSTVPPITVLSPNGGETWQKGTTQTIKWNSNLVSIPEQPIIYDISLVPYCPSGQVCATYAPFAIAQGVSGSTYNWTVGKTASGGDIPAGQYKVTISSAANGSVTDQSDSAFTIAGITTQSTDTSLSPEAVSALAEFSQKKNLNLASILAAIAQLIEAFK